MSLSTQLRHAWNAFRNKDEIESYPNFDHSTSYGRRPDVLYRSFGSDKSILSSIITRIAIDASEIEIKHVRLDDNDRFLETIDSGLNYCLNTEANIDQAATYFRQNVIFSLLDEGVIAIVPVDTSINPNSSGSFDIKTMRVGKILQWSATKVEVRLWRDEFQRHEDVWVDKRFTAIVENPLYKVMNEPNSMLQRLNRKLQILDAIDEASGSNKLDLIIQLPYVIKSEARAKQAESRQKAIEMQLKTSELGIAYTDATERITQLNRPVENKLQRQIEYLWALVYGQLGITEDVFLGKADEATMLNYYNRTIKPILTAITEEMSRTFLTKTARSQKQSVRFFRDPFKLVPMETLSEMADKFTRNEILSSNEIRGIIGFKPSNDPQADELRNKNLPAPVEEPEPSPPDPVERNDNQNGT